MKKIQNLKSFILGPFWALFSQIQPKKIFSKKELIQFLNISIIYYRPKNFKKWRPIPEKNAELMGEQTDRKRQFYRTLRRMGIQLGIYCQKTLNPQCILLDNEKTDQKYPRIPTQKIIKYSGISQSANFQKTV